MGFIYKKYGIFYFGLEALPDEILNYLENIVKNNRIGYLIGDRGNGFLTFKTTKQNFNKLMKFINEGTNENSSVHIYGSKIDKGVIINKPLSQIVDENTFRDFDTLRGIYKTIKDNKNKSDTNAPSPILKDISDLFNGKDITVFDVTSELMGIPNFINTIIPLRNNEMDEFSKLNDDKDKIDHIISKLEENNFDKTVLNEKERQFLEKYNEKNGD